MNHASNSNDRAVLSHFKTGTANTCTHYRLTTPKQKLVLPVEKVASFWTDYCNIISDDESSSLFLAEAIPNHATPIPIIVDIIFHNDNSNDMGDIYDPSFIRHLVCCYQETITEYIITNAPEDYTCVVLTNSSTLVVMNNLICTHIRLQFPYCKLDIVSQKYLRAQFIRKLRTSLIMSCLTVQPLECIDDMVVIPNEHVTLFGSSENPTSSVLEFYNIYMHIGPEYRESFLDDYTMEVNFIKTIADTFFINYHDDYMRGLIDNSCFTDHSGGFAPDHWLPYFLSIRYWTRVSIMNANKDEMISGSISADGESLFDKLLPHNIIRDMLILLNENRFIHDYYCEEVGKAIKNADDSENGLCLWASHARCFDNDQCNVLWDTFPDNNMVDYKTLAWYARHDSPAGYNAWHENLLSLSMKQALSGLQADVAYTIYLTYWLDITCTFTVGSESDNSIKWLEFKNHHWSRSGPQALKRNVLTHFVSRCERLRTKMSTDVQNSNDHIYKSSGESLIVNINKLIKQIKTKGFLDACVSLSILYFLNDDFHKYYHKNKMITGFLNCVFEVYEDKFTRERKLIQREGKPQDYIMVTTNRKFENIHSNSPHITNYNKFMDKIFPDRQIRKWFETWCATGFIGGNIDKILPLFIGKLANNGKSTTMTLLSMMFGPLVIRMPTTVCTGHRGKSNETTSELMRLQYARFALLQEPGAFEELKGGPTKELTGNDSLYIRGLYKEGEDRDNQANLAVIGNNEISVDAPDQALEDRIAVVPFNSVFRKNAPSDPNVQKQINIYQVDKSIDVKLPSIVKGFGWTLVNTFSDYAINGFPTSTEIERLTDRYWCRTDYYYGFVKHYIEQALVGNEIDVYASINIYDAHQKFGQFLSIVKPDKTRPPPVLNFCDRMVKYVGEPTEQETWIGYRYKTNNMFYTNVVVQTS